MANKFSQDEVVEFFNYSKNEWVKANYRGPHMSSSHIVVYEGKNWCVINSDIRQPVKG